MDPTLKMLRETAALLDGQNAEDPQEKARINEMLDFFSAMDAWYGEMRRMPLPMRVKLVKLGGKVHQWLQ